MKIIQKRKNFFVLSGAMIIASIVFLFMWGLNFGIDFTGGVLLEATFPENVPEKSQIEESLQDLNLGSLTVQSSEEKTVMIRFAADDDSVNKAVQEKLQEKFEGVEMGRVEFISSVISEEFKSRALSAIIFAIIGIALYVAWAFRKVSYPVKSWKYGVAAVIALFHDVLITIGIFSYLGRYHDVEINIPFVAALLTILGYSVNDTIVIFDRIRENLIKTGSKKDFEGTVNKSIVESLGRSINTSLTVIVVLIAIIFLGGFSIKFFAVALLLGIFFGTYSSIFVASAALVEIWKHKNR